MQCGDKYKIFRISFYSRVKLLYIFFYSYVIIECEDYDR